LVRLLIMTNVGKMETRFTGSRWKARAPWVLQVVLGLAFLAAGGAKLAGMQQFVDLFDKIGFGQWFRYFTALCEIVGGVLLFWPKTVLPAVALLCCVIVGAAITHLSVTHDSLADAVVFFVLLATLAWLRKPR
jgi:putative oxidoreductase